MSIAQKNMIIPEDYQDLIWKATYFILGKIAPFVPRSIHPNYITYTAFISALLGCFLLYVIDTPMAYLYWFVCNFIWYLLDALDGIHARLTGQTSSFGGFLDHYLDNIFFAVMLTVFVLKFDLAYPLYIYAIILRVTAALMVFLVETHTDRFYLGTATGGLELILFSTVMILSYFFPDLNLSQHLSNPTALMIIEKLHLQSGLFMKLALMVYIIGVPVNMVAQWRFVKRELVK
jgi:phosphatidylglycerophosphate synthase